MNKKLKKFILFPIFAAFMLSFFSCENLSGNDSETEVKKEETPVVKEEKAYIIFSLVEQKPKNKTVNNGRTISSVIVSSLFSEITFKGTREDGHTITFTANSFSELSGKKIEVETGKWTFTLEAFMGKTDDNPGEKYIAKLTDQTIEPGPNYISMKLTADQEAITQPELHPGSWELLLEFPGKAVNLVEISLYKYEDFIAATDPSTLTPVIKVTKEKGVDYFGNGDQSLKIQESERASGNYIMQVNFCITSENPDGTVQKEVINSWQEFMRINPGATSSGTITLPQTNLVYKIEYVNAHWDTSYAGDIIVNYTKDSGQLIDGARKISLPPAEAMSWAGHEFKGWYLDEDFTTAAPASFPVSDLEDKKFYAKWREFVYNIYIDCNGDNDNDGTLDHPLQSISEAYAKFDFPTETDDKGKPVSTIYILSDYIAENETGLRCFDTGQGTTEPVKINIVGKKGNVEGAPVIISANLSSDQSFLYLVNKQRFEISNVNIISDQRLNDSSAYNGYGCFVVEDQTTLKLTNCSITNYYAKSCIIAVKGDCWLDNVTISDNVAVSDPVESTQWGCAVHIPSGTLHIKNKVLIENNQTWDNMKNNLNLPYNVWIGKDAAHNTIVHKIEIEGPITGSHIGIKLDPETRTFTNKYASNESIKHPEKYFFSDSGLDVVKDSDGEAAIKCAVYVSEGVSDTTANGSKSNPFGDLTRAIQKITSFNDASLDASIYVTGTVKSNTVISGTSGSPFELKANSLCIEGTGSGSDWKTAAGKSVLTGDLDEDGTGDDAVITMSANIPLELRNLTITKGNSTSSGGGLSYDLGKNVNIQNCIFTLNDAQDLGGAVYYAGTSTGGSITIKNCQIDNNIVRKSGDGYGQGGAIYFKEAELTLEDTTFTTNIAAVRGGAIYAGSNAVVKIKNSIIEKNAAGSQGGGIYIANSASGEMEDENSIIRQNAIIQKNITSHTAANERSGGAVYVAEGGSFTMTDGEISGNAAYSGGAVFVRGAFNLNGGTISSNKRIVTNSSIGFENKSAAAYYSDISYTMATSNASSNIEVGIPGIFTMNEGSTITSTLARGQNGAAVCVYASVNGSDPDGGTATFNMKGGEIKGLTSDENAVIYLEGDPASGKSYNIVFNMYGGKITGNKTIKNTGNGNYGYGGAIYLGPYSTFTMTGGEISGNDTYLNKKGGAIYIAKKTSPDAAVPKLIFGTGGKESTIKITGNKSNTGATAITDNINFSDNAKAVITIQGPLSSASEIGIYKAFTLLPFSTGFVTNCSSIVPSDVFTSDLGLAITNKSGVEVSYSSGTVNISPGLPENYVCKWTQTLSGSKRNITITIKTREGETVTPDEDSIQVDFYKGADIVLSVNSLSFDLPSWWTEVPEGSPFHVKFNIKADDSVTYSYDYWPTEGE